MFIAKLINETKNNRLITISKYPLFMKNQKVESVDVPEKEFINGAWVDVKLCTVKAKKRQQKLADFKNKKSNSKDKTPSSSDYTELHYRNYE